MKESARRTENGELFLTVHPQGLADEKEENKESFMHKIVREIEN